MDADGPRVGDDAELGDPDGTDADQDADGSTPSDSPENTIDDPPATGGLSGLGGLLG
jgi:hypothetical protein